MDELRRHRRWEDTDRLGHERSRAPHFGRRSSVHNYQAYARLFERLRSFQSLQAYSHGCCQPKEEEADEEACPLSVVSRIIRGCTDGREWRESGIPCEAFDRLVMDGIRSCWPLRSPHCKLGAQVALAAKQLEEVRRGGVRDRNGESLLGQKLTDGANPDLSQQFDWRLEPNIGSGDAWFFQHLAQDYYQFSNLQITDEHLKFAEHESALTVMRIDPAMEGILGSCEYSSSTPMERTAWRSKRVHCRTTSTCRSK